MKIGMQELLIVFIVALVVLGPDKMPLYAKRFGEALRAFKKYSSEATKDIRESVVEPLEEAQKPLREAMEPITDLKKEVDSNVKDLKKSFQDIGKAPVNKQEEAEESPSEDDSSRTEEAPDAQETSAVSETPAASEINDTDDTANDHEESKGGAAL